MKYQFVATCLFGLEKFVAEEIDFLRYKRLETITFEGDITAIARCNIWLRSAERLYIKLGSFDAPDFTSLFDGTNALPFENWISKDDAFPVKGHSVHSKLKSIPDCQSITKKAIAARLSNEYGIEWFCEEGVKYQIEFFIMNDIVSIMIDTSGTALHKRGYRPVSGEAPLQETLAAAMVKIARPREDVIFWDPFCGSGTIPIEAALIMTNTAPGLFRSFVSEDFYDIPPYVWKNAREEAKSLIKPNTEFISYASDIDPKMVSTASENIERAGMKKYIKCFCKDALQIGKGGMKGTLVCNPPYGERMMTPRQVYKLYSDMGRCFSALERWQIYILTSDENFERHYGKKADKIRRLYNGMIKCNYYQFFRPTGNGSSKYSITKKTDISE